MINIITLSKYILIAFTIALIWMIIARKEYEYNKKFSEISGINIFPLVVWTIGLTVMIILYDYIAYIFLLQKNIFIAQLIIFSTIYWVLLLIAETIGYRVFKIHNEKAAKYRGIPILNCMHTIWWMKIAYFSMGPIMFIVCKVLGIEAVF